MPSSRTSYTGDGSTAGPYTAPTYIDKSHVTATVDGVSASFTWTNSTQITFDSAPAASSVIAIQRSTPDGTTTFSNGAALNQEALNTVRLAAQYQAEELEDDVYDLRDSAFYMHSGGVAHTFGSGGYGGTTLVPFGTTVAGGSAATGGQYTTPFDGLWFVSVTITPDTSSLTLDENWIVSIGYTGATSAKRSWFEVKGDPDLDSVTFSTMINMPRGEQIGAYIKRAGGTGILTLNTSASDNQIAGFCVKKS